MKDSKFVSVVLTLHNNDTFISSYLDGLSLLMNETYDDHEIIIINDASNDHTLSILNEKTEVLPFLRIVSLSKNCGESISACVGLDSAIGDFVVVLNPAFDKPQLVLETVNTIDGGSDIVYGVGSISRRKGLSGLIAWLFHWYVEKFIDINVPRNTTTLRGLSREALRKFIEIEDCHLYYKYIDSVIGYSYTELKYEPEEKYSSNGVRSIGKAITDGINILAENSKHPLRIVSIAGLTIALANSSYMAYIVSTYFLKDSVLPGWTTLSLQVSVLFMTVIIMLIAISEYIGMTLQKIKNKPTYFVRGEKNSSVKSITKKANIYTESQDANHDYD